MIKRSQETIFTLESPISHEDDPFSHSHTASEDVTSRVLDQRIHFLDHTVLQATTLLALNWTILTP